MPAEILAAVNEKQRSDEYQTAELIARGTKASPIRTGADGGMHPVFLAALRGQDPNAASSPFRTAAMLSTPVTLPRHVVPPRLSQQAAAGAEPAEPARAQAPDRPSPRAQRNGNAGLFSTLYAGANSRGRAAAKEATGAIPNAMTPAPAGARAVRPSPAATAPAAAEQDKERPAKAAQPPTNATPQAASASTASTASSASGPSTMPPAGSFESRWLAITSRSRF